MTQSPLSRAAQSLDNATPNGDGFTDTAFVAMSAVAGQGSDAARRYSYQSARLDPSIEKSSRNRPYATEVHQPGGPETEIDMPAAFWNTVGSSFNAFMHESFIDEIAATGDADPLALRKKIMARNPVATKLLEAVGLMSDWDTQLPKGKARGLAFMLSSGTWIAEVIQIAQTDDGIRVEKVFCAADAGFVLDERKFRLRMMSGIIEGLSTAIGPQISVSVPRNDRQDITFSDTLRAHQCPDIEVELLSNSTHMGTVEPAATPVLPALANAIFALTGKRIRKLPLSQEVEFL